MSPVNHADMRIASQREKKAKKLALVSLRSRRLSALGHGNWCTKMSKVRAREIGVDMGDLAQCTKVGLAQRTKAWNMVH
ncbi:hypothetical protein E2562_011495 [Oryza meyeriana var. granulata]|uniref:Uncharacterized protein n=1 Tax=Oryza meyeriana var. granulata TaxID=110450 RepID=A0A6G1D477_9ORYZ|nr:hypothetical protein E2562_011495 [Oryza meyeriana var. granulata]